MAYKKYIKRNGKIYGPYLYQSKRVGGKVVSEYVGDKKSKKGPKNNLLIFVSVLAILFIFVLSLFLFNSKFFSGKAIFQNKGLSNENAQEGISTVNNLKDFKEFSSLNVNNGEFKQSVRNYKNWIIVTFEFGSQKIEYSYSNTLSKEDLKSLIERDKTKWLGKISNQISA